jgi:hypothetical protein
MNDGDDSDGDSDDGGGKVICTAMNVMYGFGSFRNAIWMRHDKSDNVRFPNTQYLIDGYHKIAGPLTKKMPKSLILAKILGRIARVRTDRVRRELKNRPLTLESRIHMSFCRYPCIFVGWLISKGILEKYDMKKHKGIK